MRKIGLGACVLLVLTGCVARGGASSSIPQPEAEPAGLFAAAVDHFAARVRGRLLVDPRPLRPGADLATVQDEDLAPDAAPTERQRAAVLAARGISATDAVADFRCTFSSGVRVPPEREAVLQDSIRQRSRACRAREPYTTLIVSLSAPAGGENPAGAWHLEAVAMTVAGFQIWDLYLRAGADGAWQVTDARTRLNIQS